MFVRTLSNANQVIKGLYGESKIFSTFILACCEVDGERSSYSSSFSSVAPEVYVLGPWF